MEMQIKCRVCGNMIELEGMDSRYIGCRDHIRTDLPGTFDYATCDKCGSLSITKVPEDLTERYGGDYYSFMWKPGDTVGAVKVNRARELIDKFKLTEKSSVLEWGGGTIEGVMGFYENGVGEDDQLQRLRCYDPFGTPIDHKGIKLQTTIPTDLKFDLVMSIHSLEHTVDVRDTLTAMKSVVNEHGSIYIELPVADGLVLQYFGKESAQLDPPRHLNIPTIRGLQIAAEDCGLEMSDVTQQQTPFGLIMSEQYAAGKSYKQGQEYSSSLDKEYQNMYNGACNYLNRLGLADQVSFVLRRKR